MSYKVLIIDDAEAIHSLVRAELAQDDIIVLDAYEGTAGIEAAKRLRPDLILLDVSMPGMDGYEVCELLSIQSETAPIPVIFLTANAEPANRTRGLNAGATDYIAKPFYGEELRARVRVSLRFKALVEMETRRSMRDGLTGLWNRTYLDDRILAETAIVERYHRPLACMMIDLDHFKALNDGYGHDVGDSALRAVAGLFGEMCRREDVACRYGGEEFAVLCPGVQAGGAAVIAERLRARIEATNIAAPGGTLKVTASFGVSDVGGGMDFLRRADQALYKAKRDGRNRVALAA